MQILVRKFLTVQLYVQVWARNRAPEHPATVITTRLSIPLRIKFLPKSHTSMLSSSSSVNLQGAKKRAALPVPLAYPCSWCRLVRASGQEHDNAMQGLIFISPRLRVCMCVCRLCECVCAWMTDDLGVANDISSHLCVCVCVSLSVSFDRSQ